MRRQWLRERETGSEIVIAASPVSIGAGVLADLLFRRRGPLVAFIVGANVGANVDPGAPGELATRHHREDAAES